MYKIKNSNDGSLFFRCGTKNEQEERRQPHPEEVEKDSSLSKGGREGKKQHPREDAASSLLWLVVPLLFL